MSHPVNSRLTVLALVVAGLFPAVAPAQSGSWSQAASGSIWNWSSAVNWTGGIVADGVNNTATFATAGLTTGVSINLDSPRTIGALVFDNPTNNFGWTIQGSNALTLSNSTGPTIAVNNANISAAISVPLAGAGFSKTGPGTLLLTGNNTALAGGITVSAGVLGVTTNGSASPLGSGTVTLSGGTLRLGDGSGYNQRMIVASGTFATSGITATMDGGTGLTGYTFYAKGQNVAKSNVGLPMGTTVTSAANPAISYTLPTATPGVNESLLLDTTHSTGRFLLATPTSGLSTISFLTSAANPGTTLPRVTATIHYTDGTPDATGLTFNTPDWLSGGGGRISANGYATGGLLFDGLITNPSPAATIGSIDLSWAVGSNAAAHTIVLALGGPGGPIPVAGPVGAQSFTNSVAVTADSTIDVRTSAGSALGNVTIGSNTLSVTTSDLLATPALTLGGVSMTGNPIFNVAAGITVTTSGAFSDGGIVRTVTKSGAGALTVAAATPSLQPGTGLTVNAGTLSLNSATGFGSAPVVTVNGGNLNLLAGINPTFASLAGTGGTVTLNGNALAFGGTTASFAGVIAIGSPVGGSIIKNGAGTQTLTGANTYSGGTTINAGALVASPGSMGTGTVTMAGGTLAVGPTLVSIGSFGSGWTTNGTATFPGANVLQITPAAGGAGSAWFNTPIAAGGPFTINFTLTSLVNAAGGMTVGFQNAGLAALGAGGNEFGYTGITPSAALAINFNPPYTQGGVGSGIGLLTNGASPSTIAPMRSTAPVNLAGGQFQPPAPAQITMNYDGSSMSVSMAQGAVTYSSPALPFNITGAVGSSAFFGFTDSSAGVLSQLQISDFSFSGAGHYTNNVAVTTSSTITVAATASAPTVTMGTLTMAAGTTLTVGPDSSNPAGSPFGLAFTGTTVNGAGTFNVANNAAGAGTISLGPVANGSGTGAITLIGGGNLVVSGGTIGGRLDLGASSMSMNGVSLTVGSLAGTGGTLSGNGTSAITLTVGSDKTSSTYGGNIVNGSTGALALVKTGFGSLNLTGTNTYSGGTTISDGTLGVNGDTALGSGPVTISALGVLNYTANASTTRSFALAGGSIATAAGVTLTVNGGTLAGGFLEGAGTFATDPTNGARFASMTGEPSIGITSNSASDRFINFTNGGKLSVAPGVNASGANTIANLNGFTNQGGGTVIVGAGSRVNVANFQTDGVVTVNPATVSGQFSLLTNVGASVLSFNTGSRTFIGTAATAANFVAGMDLHGQNAVLKGSFFSNNGFVADSVGGSNLIVDAGSLYKGVGTTFVNIITQNGGQVKAGDCPGGSVFGRLTIGPGAVDSVLWQINDAKGAGGPTPDANDNVSGWSEVQASKVANPVTNQVSTGNVTWTASPTSRFTFALQTLLNPTPLGADNLGPMANFDPAHSYAWPVITFEGTYAGPTDSATLTADTLFDLSGFQNPHPGTFGMQFDAGNRSIDLVYSPSAVPEPGTLALTTVGGLGLIRAIRRRRRG